MTDQIEPIDATKPRKPSVLTRIFCVVLAFVFIPGVVHLLNGRGRAGLVWFFANFIIIYGSLVLLGLPGILCCVAAFMCAILFVIYLIFLSVSTWKNTPCLRWYSWLLTLICVFLFNFFMNTWITPLFKKNVVSAAICTGSSMSPTILSATSSTSQVAEYSDRMIVNHFIYRWTQPRRGDVVMCTEKDVDGQNLPSLMIQRIVAIPGDTIDIDSPYVLVNGERLQEPKIFKKMSSKQDGYPGYLNLSETEHDFREFPLPITLEPNEYYLLGDNSTISLDSRFYGPVSRDDIVGRVIRIYFPFSRMKEIE